MELIALKVVSDGVGSINAGQEFSAGSDFGEQLIRSGQACLKSEYFGQVTAGRWQDATVVIIGGGPSVQPEDFETVREWRFAEGASARKVVVVNTSYQFALWADLLYGADQRWWQYWWSDIQQRFPGERWTQDLTTHKLFGVSHVTCERREGLSRLRGVIHHGGNSGYQAIGLVYEFGVKKVVLAGFDMQKTFDKTHHHGNHPKPMVQAGPFHNWLPNFQRLASDSKRAGLRIVNASRHTALKYFEQRSLEDALREDG